MKQDLLPTFSSQPVKISLELWTLTGSFHNEPHFLRQKKKKKPSHRGYCRIDLEILGLFS